jgi:competence protein ComGC
MKYLFSEISLPIGLFLLLFGIAALVIVPNIDNISEKLGFDTKASLKTVVAEQKHTIDAVVKDNKDQANVAQAKDEAQAAKDDATKNQRAEEKKATDKVNGIEGQKKKKINDIQSNPKLTTSEKDQAISAAQIDSVWDTFCSFNQHPTCPKGA